MRIHNRALNVMKIHKYALKKMKICSSHNRTTGINVRRLTTRHSGQYKHATTLFIDATKSVNASKLGPESIRTHRRTARSSSCVRSSEEQKTPEHIQVGDVLRGRASAC